MRRQLELHCSDHATMPLQTSNPEFLQNVHKSRLGRLKQAIDRYRKVRPPRDYLRQLPVLTKVAGTSSPPVAKAQHPFAIFGTTPPDEPVKILGILRRRSLRQSRSVFSPPPILKVTQQDTRHGVSLMAQQQASKVFSTSLPTTVLELKTSNHSVTWLFRSGLR